MKDADKDTEEQSRQIGAGPAKQKPASSFRSFVRKKSREYGGILKGDVPKALGALGADICILGRLFRASAAGKYPKAPVSIIVAIIVGLLYLISPIDILPEVLRFFGYLDDAFVVALGLSMIRRDLEAFRSWEKDQD